MKLFSSSRKRGRNNKEQKIERDEIKERSEPSGDNSSGSQKKTPEEIKKINEMIEKYQKKKMKRRIIILGVLTLIIIALLITIKLTIRPPEIKKPDNTSMPTTGATDPVESSIPTIDVTNRKEDYYTFVIVGKDDGNGNTDTMIVGAFDVKNKKLNMLNIPRDTLVNVPWSVKKANTLYYFSDNGIDGFKENLKNILGFTVDSYIVVDLDAFVAIVDAIGGVYFDVPVNMDYEDPLQDLYIHIKKGYQHLDGEQAMGVVRFRSGYPGADIDRIKTQQSFMKAVANQLLQLGNVTKVKEFADIFAKYVETDLDVGNIAWYGIQFLGLKDEDINFYTLPEFYNDSVRGLSYCSILIDDWLTLLNECFNPYLQDIEEKNLSILTRDENGNLYATNGVIAGGIDSFYNNHSGSSDADPTPDITPPAENQNTEESIPPEESQTPDTDATPLPVESMAAENQNPEENKPPAQTDSLVITDTPQETQPVEATMTPIEIPEETAQAA